MDAWQRNSLCKEQRHHGRAGFLENNSRMDNRLGTPLPCGTCICRVGVLRSAQAFHIRRRGERGEEQNALYHSPAKQNSADGGGSSRSADLSVSLYSAYDLRSHYGNERKSGPRRARLPYLRGCLTRSYSYPLGAVCSYGETVWRRRVQAPQGIRPRGERRAE